MKLYIRFKKATPSNSSGKARLEVSSRFKIAKITLLLLFAVSFTTFANNAQVDISLKNASLKEVMTRIAKQTEYAFMYSDADVKDAKRISVNLKKAPLEKA